MRIIKRRIIDRTKKAGKECQGCGREICRNEVAVEIVYLEPKKRAWSEYYCQLCKHP